MADSGASATPAAPDIEDDLSRVAAYLVDFTAGKYRHYDGSFDDILREWGWRGMGPRMQDKYRRLRAVLTRDPVDEADLLEVLRDTAGYCLLALRHLLP